MSQDPISDERERQDTIPVSALGGGTPRPAANLDRSPRWSATTKLIIGLLVAAIFAYLLVRFLNIVGPLLLAFILAYLIYPLAETVRNGVKISWRASVGLLYLLLLALVLGLIAVGGVTMVDQVQNLIGFLTKAVGDLPGLITQITSTPLQIGPFTLDLSVLDTSAVTQQVLGAVQPLLSQTGSSVVSLASGIGSVIGWLFFILLISYFILAESNGFRLFFLNVPGYAYDMQRLGAQLSRIWDAFLRGQILIVLMTIGFYTVLLGVLGVKFYFGLALLAGLARFIPYVGPAIAWVTYGLVTFFQGSTAFGISPLAYSGLVVGLAWLVDVVLDNYVTPKIMSNALRVHPAATMVSALIAFNLLGVIGMILAAPVLATFKLLLDYIFSKLFDRDPWEGLETISAPLPLSFTRWQQGVLAFRDRLFRLRASRPK